MRRLLFSLLAALLLFPVSGFAQNEADSDFAVYLQQLNEQCPIACGEGMALKAFALDGDTVFVDLKVPSVLAPFLSLLTEDTDQARRLWLKELTRESEVWNQFVEYMQEDPHPMVILFKPKGNTIEATLSYGPADVKRIE